MHIALIIPGLRRIGGAEQQVIQLARSLRANSWQVTVVALSGAAEGPAGDLRAAGIDFLSLGMSKGLADPRGWIRFHAWLRVHRPEIVHAHLPHAVWLARWSRLAVPMRALIDTIHTSATGPLVRRLGYRFSRWLPDKVTAVSEAVGDAYRNAGMVGRTELTVLTNGIDTEHWVPDAPTKSEFRRALGVKEKEFLWFTAGRLDAVKDYPTLLRAFAALPPVCRLFIAGSGPLLMNLQALAEQLGVERRVRFLGHQREILGWMQSADGFVLSSLWEGLPMAVLEASACALPCVATAVAGTREAVMNGVTGFLAPSANPAALSTAMSRMMVLAPERRAEMGVAARTMVLERFSLKATIRRWEQLYGELLEANITPKRMG